jgi:hypothetical protein
MPPMNHGGRCRLLNATTKALCRYRISALRSGYHHFAAKQRPSFDPLIMHIADRTALEALTPFLSAHDQPLMDAF